MRNTMVSFDGLPARTSEADIRRQDAHVLTRFWTSQRQFGTSIGYAAYAPPGRCRGRSSARIPGWCEGRCDSPPHSTRLPVRHPIGADGQGDGRDNPGRAPHLRWVSRRSRRGPRAGVFRCEPQRIPRCVAGDRCLPIDRDLTRRYKGELQLRPRLPPTRERGWDRHWLAGAEVTDDDHGVAEGLGIVRDRRSLPGVRRGPPARSGTRSDVGRRTQSVARRPLRRRSGRPQRARGSPRTCMQRWRPARVSWPKASLVQHSLGTCSRSTLPTTPVCGDSCQPPFQRGESKRCAPAFRPSLTTSSTTLLVTGPTAGSIWSQAFAFPLPFTVICELLGVPQPDRASLGEGFTKMLVPTSNPREYAAAKEASDSVVAHVAITRRSQADRSR